MADARRPLSSYNAPKYWPMWFLLAVLRLVCLLPHRMALAVGRGIGRLAFTLGKSRRQIVRRNLRLCFPELSAEEIDALAHRHFAAMGMMVIETGLARWSTDQHIASMCKVIGTEHLNHALQSGRGVILLTAHFTALELTGRMLRPHAPPFDAVFRKNRSEFITEWQRSTRERAADTTIEKRDIKQMVRNLRAGKPVWYAPDQSFSRKGAEVIDFFGVPCMHTTATSTLARLGKAAVIPFFPRRLENGHYELVLLPAFENFPGDSPVEDTNRYVEVLEQHIRTCPEQYFWIHRKFKDLPDGYPDYYAALDASK